MDIVMPVETFVFIFSVPSLLISFCSRIISHMLGFFDETRRYQDVLRAYVRDSTSANYDIERMMVEPSIL
jgi:hypothetical protein